MTTTMKTILLIVNLTFAAATGALAQAQTNSGSPAQPAPPVTSRTTNAPLGVDELMRNVDRHRGSVQVEGVVSAVSATNQSVALIDVREFQQCGLAKCAELTLPVRWTGTMPTVGQAVRVSGEVEEKKGKLAFVAKSVEKFELPAKGK